MPDDFTRQWGTPGTQWVKVSPNTVVLGSSIKSHTSKPVALVVPQAHGTVHWSSPGSTVLYTGAEEQFHMLIISGYRKLQWFKFKET